MQTVGFTVNTARNKGPRARSTEGKKTDTPDRERKREKETRESFEERRRRVGGERRRG